MEHKMLQKRLSEEQNLPSNNRLQETPEETLQRYRERAIRWEYARRSQLSFYNNFLLTMGIGFLSFSYRDAKEIFRDATFTLKAIDYSLTFYFLSLIFVGLSIILGLLVAWSRLYDFRLTQHINLTRQREFKHSGKKLKDGTPPKVGWMKLLKIICKILVDSDDWRINIDFKKWNDESQSEYRKDISKRFQELRRLSFNLGKITWIGTELQTICLGFSILFYVLAKFAF